MPESHDVAQTLQDLSVLYELSLSVGSSIELEESCAVFLRTLLARKSLDFAAVWIRERFVREAPADGEALRLVYAAPAWRARERELPADHPLAVRASASPGFSLAHGEPGFAEIVTEAGVQRGAYAVHRLGAIGFLKLYSAGRDAPFSALEQNKLRAVLEKFTVALEGALGHARLLAAEERRRELELSMLHAQKLESLGLMAGSVAHDFNNLLAVILGSADLARAALHGVARRNLDAVVEAAERAAGLCDQLLAYAGGGPHVDLAVDLNAAVSDMLDLLALSVSRKASVERRLAEGLSAVQGDPGQIRQIVLNLVVNASEALGAAAGSIVVSTGTALVDEGELAGFQRAERCAPGTFATLDVTDTGRGMDADTLARVFDPFFTTKFTGRGLGMAAVLGIVRRHGGAIRLRSRPGAGTEVRVLLPCARSATRAQGEPERTPGPCEGLVLVVDDEPMVRTLLVQIVERLGFSALSAAGGAEALELHAARWSEIDVVLLDRTMPGMSGDEVFAQLARRHPAPRVVMMSGYSALDSLPQAAGRAPDAFLQKPFRAADLRRTLLAVLGERVSP